MSLKVKIIMVYKKLFELLKEMAFSSHIPLQLVAFSIILLQLELMHRSIDNVKQLKKSYDYIVVGAGTAGAVVAYRLTEDPNINVLLLEAGPPNSVITDPPGLAVPLWRDIQVYDWGYQTVPQRLGLAFKDPGVISHRTGRVIGGTSSINGLIHVLGNRFDYDEWSETFGAKDWSHSHVLPYFKKLENNSDHILVAENYGYHGTSGPVGVQSDPYAPPLLLKLQKIFNHYGYPTTDLNGDQQLGVAFTQMTIKHGFRSGAGNAYIDPNRHQKNLFIKTNAFVTKILFSKSKEVTATGVEFIHQRKRLKVNAKFEIIVCAGTFNSPQILMLSGIGPRDHLQSLAIPVVKSLPVGDHLQDHPKVVFMNVLKDQVNVPIAPELSIPQLYEFFLDRKGPLVSYSCLYCYHNTRSNPRPDWPNTLLAAFIEKMSDNITQICDKYGDRHEEWKHYYRSYLGKYYLRTDVNLRRPRSFGSVRLSSKDPFDKPLIDPNFFQDNRDFEDLVEATKFMLFLLQESPIGKHIEFNDNPIPGCSLCPDRPIYACDSYIRCYIKLNGEKELHPVGTCRMGAVERPDVVVDPTLKVKHVSRLRVCDASVMPFVPNGNTNGPTLMIGEKCADLIKDDLYSNLVN